MVSIFLVYFFLIGVIIGSFLNVVILRHNTGKTTGGRSACMICKHQLTSRELVPLFSFLFQRGKCTNCKTRISWQYPLVELATGVLFAVNFYFLYAQSYSFGELMVSVGLTSCIWALMVVIFVYDLRHKIIPDVFSFSAFGLSVVYAVLSTFVFKNNTFIVGASSEMHRAWIPASAGMTNVWAGMTKTGAGVVNVALGMTPTLILQLSGGLIFYLLIYALWKFSKGRMIGLGDAKLLLSIGTILGLVYGLSSIFIAVWVGSLYGIFILFKARLRNGDKHITMKTEIPFGPFLILGFLIVYFSKIDVTNLGFILENF